MSDKLVNFTAGTRKSAMGGILLPSGSDMSWIQGMDGNGDPEVPSGTINGSSGSDGNATFTLSRIPGAMHLWKNGLRLTPGSDYTLSGLTITYLSGAIPVTGDSHIAELF